MNCRILTGLEAAIHCDNVICHCSVNNIPGLIFLGVGFFYLQMYQHFGLSGMSVWIITLFHLLFVAGIYYLVRQKNQISGFIEKQVQVNPIRIVCLSFIPFWFLFLARPLFHIPVREWSAALDYPMRRFNGTLIEFSFYLAVLSIVGGVLSLIFSIKFPGKVSLRSLFEKPSVLFLVLFGVFIELMAASTRAIRFPFDTELIHSGNRSMWVEGYFNKMAGAASFGIVYLIASFLITYYNKLNTVNRFLLIFSSFDNRRHRRRFKQGKYLLHRLLCFCNVNWYFPWKNSRIESFK